MTAPIRYPELDRAAPEAISPLLDPGRTRMTRNQVLIWLGQQMHPESRFLGHPVVFEFTGEIEPDAFCSAFEALVERADILRSVFATEDGLPRRRVLPRVDDAIARVDLSGELDPVGVWRDWLDARRQCVFDPDRPLYDAVFVTRGAGDFAFYLNLHQLVADGWSVRLIYLRLAEFYGLALQGRLLEAPLLPSFDEVIERETRLAGSSRLRRAEAWWHERGQLARQAFRLPRQGEGPGTGIRAQRRLAPDVLARLREFCGDGTVPGLSADAALLNLLAAVLFGYLHRLSGAELLSLGTPLLNRSGPRLREVIGSVAHMVPLVVRVEAGDDLRRLAAKVGDETFQALQYQQVVPVNSPTAPSYDSWINNLVGAGGEFHGARVRAHWESTGHVQTALAVSLHEELGSNGANLVFDLASDCFSPDRCERMPDELLRMLEWCVEDPGRPVSEFPLCGDSDRRSVLETYNRPVGGDGFEGGLRSALAAQVARAPGRWAVEQAGSAGLTYGELWSRSRLVSGWLRAHGVGRGSLVPVRAERGADLLVAWLGVWQAGGAFLPLDPRDPEARVAQLVAQSGAGLVLSDGAEAASGWGGARWVSVGSAQAQSPGEAAAGPESPGELAYVIYTSGSTGTPKGVLIEHGGMDNHLLAKQETLGLGAGDVVAQTASPCFDIAVWQCFAPLRARGRVRVVADAVVRDPERLLAEWAEGGVTVAEVVPSLLRLVVETLEGVGGPELALRWLVVTGEALPGELCRRWLARYPAVPLVNAYGPTECSDDVTQEVVRTAPPSETVPIGRPLRNLRAYVVDGQGQLLPPGVTGELWAGGAGVGRGYLDDPARTVQHFGPDPWSRADGARLYRTGDRAHFQSDGRLVFHGRADDQVKVRGFRVELGEVEAALRRLPHVADAAVVAVPSPHGSRLRAFVTPARQPEDGDALRSQLADRLPPHMVPARVERLDAFPLNSNGKVDRGVLAARPWTGSSGSADVRPRGRLEEQVARAFCAVLGRPCVARDADFLDLGGDSIAAVRLMNRLRSEGLEVPSQLLLRHRTVVSLAAAIAARERKAPAATPSSRVPWTDAEQKALRRAIRIGTGFSDLHPASPAQAAMLRSVRIAGDPALWLTQTRVTIEGPCHRRALEYALGDVVARHAALRSCFVEDESGVVIQAISRDVAIELSWFAKGAATGSLDAVAAQHRAAGIDPNRAPLFRFAAFPRTGGLELLVTNHHLIHDGWSSGIVLRDLLVALSARRRGDAPARDEAPAFRSHAEWLARRDSAAARRFFARELKGVRWDGALSGFDDVATQAALRAPHSHAWTCIEARVVSSVSESARSRRLGWSPLLETVWATVCAAANGSGEAVLGLVLAGRSHALEGLDEIVGPVAAVLPSRTELRSAESLLDLAQRTQRRTLALSSHADVSSSRLVEWGLMPFEYAFPDGVFVFQNAAAPAGTGVGGIRVARVAVARAQTPFPIVLQAFPGPALELALEFDPERGAGRHGERLLAAASAVLARLARDPNAKTGAVLRAAERALAGGSADCCVLRGDVGWLPADPEPTTRRDWR